MLDRFYTWLIEQMKSEEGTTAVEYGVMLALITAALIAILVTMSGQLTAIFTRVSGALT